ncbi:MAG: glycerol-3-phosphate dehydrogenase [Proteobacteria bacterium]|nr:glycerol-3-phosphate dehydrogenase [Pseudomonadota bacterium]
MISPPLTVERHDLLIVGGGINGCGIARDAAGRGLKVLLCEQDDLASHTSSASTKLIHGGLRYLEQYEFGLVRKALQEREVLLAMAPHIMWPLRFVLPHDSHLRPAWMIRAGLVLYDHLARRHRLPGSFKVELADHPAGASLVAGFRTGFEYSDGWVDDARLVVLNAVDARERGATVLTRTRCETLQRDGDGWRATLRGRDGGVVALHARAVVNATGPWAAQFLREGTPVRSANGVRLVKGSHIVVPRMFAHPYAYIFQGPDGRIVFAIPYEQDFTLIGTTDVDHPGEAGAVSITDEETRYLCAMAARYFRQRISPDDVVWSYAGLRPLLSDRSADAPSVTRDYALELDRSGPPLLSVFGGKITTYRRLAEEVVDRLADVLGRQAQAWTAGALLPGGDLPDGNFDTFAAECGARWPWLPGPLLLRMAHAYGSRMSRMLGDCAGLEDLGEQIAPGLYERELAYLCQHEWAVMADDILWRRSKLGLRSRPDDAGRIDDWLARNTGGG